MVNIRRFWVNKTKYYKANILKDLPDRWVVYCWWGSLTNKRGNHKRSIVRSYEEACDLLKLISKRRIAHGYIEVF